MNEQKRNWPNEQHWFYLELIAHLLFWGLYFSSINVSWTESWFDRSIRPKNMAPFSVLLFPILFYINAFWWIPRFFKGKTWYRYFIISIGALLFLEFGRALIYICFFQQEGLHINVFLEELLSRDSIFFGEPSPFWFAMLFSFAYRFTIDRVKNTQLIDALKTEKMSMELNLLKSQINPHFLFNNLNALDDLIDQDKDQARNYLHKLSSLYRYTLKSAEKDVVPLSHELKFMEDYIFLIESRFGAAYQFVKKGSEQSMHQWLIPPTAIQGLLENAVKHNKASIEQPLKIEIDLQVHQIVVKHQKQLKRTLKEVSGTGLKNLKSRYQLLSDLEVKIEDKEGQFKVSIPLIKSITT